MTTSGNVLTDPNGSHVILQKLSQHFERKADYDPSSRQLDLHWDNQSVTAYKHVPEEVFRRLCSSRVSRSGSMFGWTPTSIVRATC